MRKVRKRREHRGRTPPGEHAAEGVPPSPCGLTEERARPRLAFGLCLMSGQGRFVAVLLILVLDDGALPAAGVGGQPLNVNRDGGWGCLRWCGGTCATYGCGERLVVGGGVVGTGVEVAAVGAIVRVVPPGLPGVRDVGESGGGTKRVARTPPDGMPNPDREGWFGPGVGSFERPGAPWAWSRGSGYCAAPARGRLMPGSVRGSA